MTNSELKPWFVTVIYYTLHVQALLYLFLSIKVTYRFKKIVKENYSNINKRNYKWILQLTYVFIYFVLTALIYNILRFGTDMSWENKLFYISAPINLAFLIWLIYKAMSQPYIFNGVDANIKLLQEYLNESEHAKQVQEKSFSSEDSNLKNRALKSKLEEYMNKEEAFLNPSLTIFDLAKGLNITSIELSLFLNKELHKNFFDYINEYRIEKAKQILQDPDKKSLTILEILYEVGFNSKSSFNTAFKKFTKKTPTQYRENTVKSRS
ncbi:MAG TPA: helix-turn-helix domain-containing protein [Yeosuana sp.]